MQVAIQYYISFAVYILAIKQPDTKPVLTSSFFNPEAPPQSINFQCPLLMVTAIMKLRTAICYLHSSERKCVVHFCKSVICLRLFFSPFRTAVLPLLFFFLLSKNTNVKIKMFPRERYIYCTFWKMKPRLGVVANKCYLQRLPFSNF